MGTAWIHTQAADPIPSLLGRACKAPQPDEMRITQIASVTDGSTATLGR